jgi:hypothetical protein
MLAGTATSIIWIGQAETRHQRRVFLRVTYLPCKHGTTPVVPNKINRKKLYPFDAKLYRLRNVIERTVCRPKDFRAIATRYDKTACRPVPRHRPLLLDQLSPRRWRPLEHPPERPAPARWPGIVSHRSRRSSLVDRVVGERACCWAFALAHPNPVLRRS